MAKIITWNQIQFDKESMDRLKYNPNAELEWRNQATAHTDCFINYKVCTFFNLKFFLAIC